jgi:hypothetical protein
VYGGGVFVPFLVSLDWLFPPHPIKQETMTKSINALNGSAFIFISPSVGYEAKIERKSPLGISTPKGFEMDIY